MWLREPLPADLPALCQEMRAADAREIYALRHNDDPFALAGDIVARLPLALASFVAGVDGSPTAIAFCGVWPKGIHTQVAEVGMFARDAFPQIAGDFVRHVRRSLIPALLARGVRRVECRALKDYASSRRLIEACGAVLETPDGMADYGPDGMTYVLFAWRKSDWS